MPEFDVNPVADEPIARPETSYRHSDEFADVPPPRAREGLPAKFRVRHAPHDVDQLMGDAPLQIVCQIPLEQLDAPDAEGDLTDLVASILEVGLLQPLLVAAREGSRFQVVAGSNRLAAAKRAGLTVVPCLVLSAEEDAVNRLRAHAERRSAPEIPPSAAPFPCDAATTADVLRTAFAEISTSMRFIDALTPLARANDWGARSSMIVGAITAEVHRATTVAAAAALLMRGEPLTPALVDCAAVLDTIRTAAGIGARLRGVDVRWTASIELARTAGDTDALTTGWSALIHVMLGMAREGDRLEIAVTTPRVRPAVILQVTLRAEAGAVSSERFLDTEWPDHAGDPAGAVMLSAAFHSARLHGGRLSVRTTREGLALTFVVPQPLDLF